jgi:hypothetical protein
MKKCIGFCAAAVLILAAASAWAANSCNVTGDLAKDGNLLIDVSWTIDTAKYKNQSPEAIRESVYQEIWKDVLPKLVKKSSGVAVSYEKSQFTKVAEEKNVIEQRPDGTKVYSYKAKVRFNAGSAAGASAAPEQSEKERANNFDRNLHYRFVNEGRD